MADAQPQHSHLEFHKSFVPEDQLATSTATAGFVPTATGSGQAVWAAQSGSGVAAATHEHMVGETYIAPGGSATFPLYYSPLLDTVAAYLNGSRVTAFGMNGSNIVTFVSTPAVNDVLTFDYELAPGQTGGTIGDGNPIGFLTLGWYLVGREVDFSTQVPVAWAEQTLYTPGAIIIESGKLFARYPNTGRLSDVLANEPAFGGVSEGDYVVDGDGYWQRLPDTFDVTDTLGGWTANTNINYGLLGDDCIFIAPGNGLVYCAEFLSASVKTGTFEPVWPTNACGGNDRFFIDFGNLILERAYTAGTVTATLNGTAVAAGDLTEADPPQGIVYFTGSANPEDVIVVSYTAIC